MKPSKRKLAIKQIFSSLMFCFAIISALAYYVSGLVVLKPLPLVFSAAIAVYYFLLKGVKVSKKDILLFIVILFCVIFSIIGSFRFALGSAFLGAQFMIMALASYVIANTTEVSLLKVSNILLIIFFVFFTYKAVSLGISPADVNHYFATSSRNIVSATCIILQVFYSSCFYLKNKRLPTFTPLLTLIVCIICYGRSGIVGAGFIVLLTAISFSLDRKNKLLFISTLTIALCASSLWLNNSAISRFASDTYTDTNFSKAGVESPRYKMNKEYWFGMTGIEFLAGRSYLSSPTIMNYDGNPHNSYIQGHHFMGLPYLIFLFYIFMSIAVAGLRSFRSVWLGSLLILLLIRVSVDTISFPGGFDLIFFYLYFTIIRYSHRSKDQIINLRNTSVIPPRK